MLRLNSGSSLGCVISEYRNWVAVTVKTQFIFWRTKSILKIFEKIYFFVGEDFHASVRVEFLPVMAVVLRLNGFTKTLKTMHAATC
jgi:hypothetical protein